MYAHIELSNTTRTDSIIQSLSWMSYASNSVQTGDNANAIDDRSTVSTTTTTANSLQQGWLATGNTNHIVSVTYTSMKSDEQTIMPDRTNFNLRAHRTDVRLVSWNVPYEKLATVDEKGVIFVWVKHDNRWSLELINDRSHSVTDMCWSHDGRMTVICYEDGFILAGSVTGQRYWSTVLNNLQTKISAVTWLPDMSHVILGTTAGQLIIMDHHGNTTGVWTLSTQSIRQLMYSCNKFYPNAPDTNPTRFVNEDYILACSLENGQVLFLNHYQDQSPISIETDLQNIKMDWSSPGEILAVGGHKRLTDDLYTNQVLFYTRRGEFLHRIQIPHTTQSLSALCWAHGNEILFAACGSFVYTIWITHKPLPSMFTMCQMKIKQQLSKTSRQFLDQYSLPLNLKHYLTHLYPSIIKGFLPDQKHLRSFVCHPLKSHLRLQCTMKRIDQDQEYSSKTTTNLSGATYVLYLEYLGGLIPLLTAKRVSKICPDFIIFDPQIKPTDLMLLSSQKFPSPRNSIRQSFLSAKLRSTTCQNVSNVPTSKPSLTSTRSSLIANRNSIYVAENEYHHGTHVNRRTKTNIDSSSDEDFDIDPNDSDDQPMIDLNEEGTKKKQCNKLMKHKYNNKLCTIAANIWGTRFKFYGNSNHLPDILGSVTYKTSFLHLQPRQMTVTVANSECIRSKPIRKSSSKKISTVKRAQNKLKRSNSSRDENQTAVSSLNLNLTSRSPVAPFSTQLQNILSSSIHEMKQCQMKSRSPISSSQFQRTSLTTNNVAFHRQTRTDSSTPNSPSTSPMLLSRSTSPAASIANFIRPISPPYIQVKEPLSPKIYRASSTTATNFSLHRQSSSLIPNSIDASTINSGTNTLINDLTSSERHRSLAMAIASVPESCFEPETYRNLSTLNSNQQKKLSFSDPTLNQTTKLSHHSQQTTNADTQEQISILSLQQLEAILPDEDDIRSDDDIDNTSSVEETSLTEQLPISMQQTRKRYTSPRRRMMVCTSGTSDSLLQLSSMSNTNETERINETSFYVMKNRPPLWNEQSQVYQLDFGGRVTLESAKNFQIEFKGKQVIQFGRIENNCYTLDFEWPFSPLQAFAVALANITQRLK